MKKGVFFTLTAFLFIVITFSYILIDNYTVNESEQTRVILLNDLFNSIKLDLERGAFIVGFRGLNAMQEYAIINGVYLDESNFEEVLLNGTINGVNATDNMTLSLWEERAALFIKGYNANLEVDLIDVGFEQHDPWTVSVKVIAKIDLYDDVASFNSTITVFENVSIIGFEDPLYVIKSNGRVTNIINKAESVTALDDHASSGKYINSSGPSYLKRLIGDNTPTNSSIGMESLVSLPELENLGIVPLNKTIVDYIYFSDDIPESFQIVGEPDWILLDTSHLNIYNATPR